MRAPSKWGRTVPGARRKGGRWRSIFDADPFCPELVAAATVLGGVAAATVAERAVWMVKARDPDTGDIVDLNEVNSRFFDFLAASSKKDA